MEEQKAITQMGGTMRLGAYDCELINGSRVYEAYGGTSLIRERHRHRYEFNNLYREEYETAGMKCVGVVDVSHTSTHACSEIAAGLAKHHHASSCHIFATVIASTFDDGDGA